MRVMLLETLFNMKKGEIIELENDYPSLLHTTYILRYYL